MTRATLRPEAALAALTVMAALAGCHDPFSPPITPVVPEPIVLDYRSPEATLRTMAAGIQAKSRGASAWLGAFADSTRPDDGTGYHQFFDPADKSAFESSCGCEAPTDWRLSQEQIFFLEFLNVRPSDDYLAVFDSVETHPDPPAGDTEALLFRRYRVVATSTDGNTTTIIATGFADLIFTKKASSWLITRWVDHVDPDVGVNPTDPDHLTMGRRRLEASR